MTNKFFENLSNNYIELFESGEDYNVIIEVGESPNIKEFKTHNAILKYRSLYFRNELTKKETNNKIKLNPHISIQYFEIIIRYIYGGVFSLENLDVSTIFDIMLIACELLLEELVKHLETHLIEVEAQWLRTRFAYVYKTSFGNKQLQKLQDWGNNIVVKYPNIIFESEYFTSLQENVLISLIKRDDLQLKEIEVWNYVIKWGIAKNPELPSESKNWTRENFQTMKITLQNCLPHIRYFQISGKDVVNNIRPYKKILEKELWKDLSNRLMAPDQQISSIILPPRIILKQTLPERKTEPFSKVITEEHKAEIATWIDKKTNIYDITSIPYDFKLLFRGSRDGFTKESFWKLCNKKANIVVVMKVKGTDEILGGYNPLGWDKSIDGYVRCDKSFIFLLKNGTVQSSILSRVQYSQYALCYHSIYGISFGAYDLRMYNNNVNIDLDKGCYCGKYAYENPIRASSNSYFSVSEYEIYQIH